MQHSIRARRALGAFATIMAASAALAAQAGAHAKVYPDTVAAGAGNAYTLVVPNENDTAAITEVELTVPEGFLIGGFEAKDGWTRETEAAEEEEDGHGHGGVITKVTWSGGKVPAGEAGWFRFTGRPDEEHAADLTEYEFAVTQTYSDGTVAEWAGPEDSDEPAPVVKIAAAGGGDQSVSSAGAAEAADGDDEEDDDGGSLGTIALIVAAVALLLGIAGLVRRGGRSLT